MAPALLSHVEHWSYAAAFYFSVQAMLGIGFGALSVSTEASAASKSPTVDDTLLGGLRSSCDPFRIQAMKWLVTFQIVSTLLRVA